MQIYKPNQTDLNVAITWEHQLVHAGNFFTSSRLFAALGNASKYLAVIPVANYVHLRNITVAVENGEIELELLENSLFYSNGTSVSSSNLNRVSNTLPSLTLFHTPNVSSYGNTIYNMSIYTDKSGSLQNDLVEEFILHKDRQYLINVHHTGAAANVRLSLTWYESSQIPS